MQFLYYIFQYVFSYLNPYVSILLTLHKEMCGKQISGSSYTHTRHKSRTYVYTYISYLIPILDVKISLYISMHTESPGV